MSNTAQSPLPSDGQSGTRIPPNVPIITADVIMDVMVGAWTSKLILGLEVNPQQFQPAAIVTLPTAPLVFAAAQILRTMATGQNREFFAKVYREFEQHLAQLDRSGEAAAAGASAPPSPGNPGAA
jgi:hypothetical protein